MRAALRPDLGSSRPSGRRGCYSCRVLSPAAGLPRERRRTWLAVAALAGAFLLCDLWILAAGPSPGKVPGSLTEEAAATTDGSHPLVRFAPGRLAAGELVACVTNGLRIKASVPVPGVSTQTHADGVSHGGATLRLHTAPDGTVWAHCGN